MEFQKHGIMRGVNQDRKNVKFTWEVRGCGDLQRAELPSPRYSWKVMEMSRKRISEAQRGPSRGLLRPIVTSNKLYLTGGFLSDV